MIRYIQYAVCCRVWVVAFGWPMGRCGYCGDKPEIVPDTVMEL